MHFHIVDAYQDTGSLLHCADSRAKFAMTILVILLIGLTPVGAFGAYVGFFALMMVGTVLARVDPMLVVRRSAIALPFAGAAIALVFTVPGRDLGTVPLVGWTISEEGVIRFASVVFKSMISIQAVVILMLTTHFTDMLWAMSALRVPRILVAIISFMYRYAFVLADEALRLTRARDSRSAVWEGQPGRSRSLVFRAKTTGGMIGSLFLRSYERSERVYQSMVARGYRGELKLLDPPPLRLRDVLIAAVPIVASVALMAASLLTS